MNCKQPSQSIRTRWTPSGCNWSTLMSCWAETFKVETRLRWRSILRTRLKWAAYKQSEDWQEFWASDLKVAYSAGASNCRLALRQSPAQTFCSCKFLIISFIMYFRKWTRMSFIDSLEVFRKHGMIEFFDSKLQLMRMFPEIYNTRHLRLESNEENRRGKNYRWEKKIVAEITDNLFTKYPDLRYEPFGEGKQLEHSQLSATLKFVNLQLKYMARGLNFHKAFDQAEVKLQAEMQEKINDLQHQQGKAANNRAKQLMTIYQQQSEYEARLKVQRMQRELYKMDKGKAYEEFSENGGELGDLAQEPERVYLQPEPFEKLSVQLNSYETKYEQQVEKFLRLAPEIIGQYQSRINTFDNLHGLEMKELLHLVRTSPKKNKHYSAKLRKLLRSLGVTLTPLGEVDFSAVENPNLLSKLQSNPLVKQALLYEELNYEFPHKQHLAQTALEIQAQIDRLKVQQTELDSRISAEKNNESTQLREKIKLQLEKFDVGLEGFRVLEHTEQRTLRLQITFLMQQLENPQKVRNYDRFQQKLLQKIEACISEMRQIQLKANIEINKMDSGKIFPEYKKVPYKDLTLDHEIHYHDIFKYLKKPIIDQEIENFQFKQFRKLIKAVPLQMDIIPPNQPELKVRKEIEIDQDESDGLSEGDKIDNEEFQDVSIQKPTRDDQYNVKIERRRRMTKSKVARQQKRQLIQLMKEQKKTMKIQANQQGQNIDKSQ